MDQSVERIVALRGPLIATIVYDNPLAPSDTYVQSPDPPNLAEASWRVASSCWQREADVAAEDDKAAEFLAREGSFGRLATVPAADPAPALRVLSAGDAGAPLWSFGPTAPDLRALLSPDTNRPVLTTTVSTTAGGLIIRQGAVPVASKTWDGVDAYLAELIPKGLSPWYGIVLDPSRWAALAHSNDIASLLGAFAGESDSLLALGALATKYPLTVDARPGSSVPPISLFGWSHGASIVFTARVPVDVLSTFANQLRADAP